MASLNIDASLVSKQSLVQRQVRALDRQCQRAYLDESLAHMSAQTDLECLGQALPACTLCALRALCLLCTVLCFKSP